jgi:hypothetical protein
MVLAEPEGVQPTPLPASPPHSPNVVPIADPQRDYERLHKTSTAGGGVVSPPSPAPRVVVETVSVSLLSIVVYFII